MKLSTRDEGDVKIIDVHGDIMIGQGDKLLRDVVHGLLSQGHKNILINLAKVPYMDSAGIGEIIRCHTSATKQGATVKLLKLTKKIKEVLTITRLITVLDHFDDEDEAIKSFK